MFSLHQMIRLLIVYKILDTIIKNKFTSYFTLNVK